MQLLDARPLPESGLDHAAETGSAQGLRRGPHDRRADTASPATSKTCRATSSPPSTRRSGGSCWPRAPSGRPRLCRCWPSCRSIPAPRRSPRSSSSTARSRSSTAKRPSGCASASAPCSGASGDADAMAYLRELFETEPDRRVPIAMALAQQPDGENWPLPGALVVDRRGRCRPGSADAAGRGRPRRRKSPRPIRQVILRGLMLRENGSRKAIELLEKWTGKQLTRARRHRGTRPWPPGKNGLPTNIPTRPSRNCRSSPTKITGPIRSCSAS